MKIDRSGKASTMSDSEFSKIRRAIKNPKYKILLDLAWYTGERWGALAQLQINDVYDDGKPREQVIFRAATRKKRPDGTVETRQVPIHLNLQQSLESYHPDPASIWLFPGRNGDKPISLRHLYNIFIAAVDSAGYGSKGISTHSTRRSFITSLHRNGISLATIRQITGHRDLKSLEKYIEIDCDQIKGAIATL